MYILFLLFCFTAGLLVIIQISAFTSTGKLITEPSKMIKAMFQEATTRAGLLCIANSTC